MRRTLSALPLLLALGLQGCDSPLATTLCTSELRPSIIAEVRDASTDAPLAAGATGRIVKGSYVEVLTIQDELVLWAEGDRTKAPVRFYEVTVDAPGYETWERQVGVISGDCGIETTRLDVRLVPAGG